MLKILKKPRTKVTNVWRKQFVSCSIVYSLFIVVILSIIVYLIGSVIVKHW